MKCRPGPRIVILAISHERPDCNYNGQGSVEVFNSAFRVPGEVSSFTGESSWEIRTEAIRGRKRHRDRNSMSDGASREHARKHLLASSDGERTPHPMRATHATFWTDGRSTLTRWMSELRSTFFSKLIPVLLHSSPPSLADAIKVACFQYYLMTNFLF